MKNSLLLFSILFLLCIKLADAQPNLPDSSHVLVVYNSLDQTSIEVKNYYQQRRGIPESNIVPLDGLVDTWITDSVTQVSHKIKLEQQGESIVDSQSTTAGWCATRHAWIYFNEKIAVPIAEHLNETELNGTPLKDIIRFIVLCKGVPFKIYSRTENEPYSGNKNVVVDHLLCFLGETIDSRDALLDYFIPGCGAEGSEIENPYFDADPYFTMEEVFIPNHYSKTIRFNGELREITLSYLVSHLSAPLYADITSMIDSSIAAINSSGYDWFIDAHPSPIHGGDYLVDQANETEYKFQLLGIDNYYFEITDTNITEHSKPIMSYSSNGVHQYWPENYITELLNFDLPAGSIFNTAESFNGYTIGSWNPILRSPGNLHGVIPEYIHIGGTVGVGHAFEPRTDRVVKNSILFPSYALGYTFIESAYLGMKSLRGDNVVVGDPLTRIEFPCEAMIISTNTILPPGDYNCDIIVDENATLTIEETAVVNFNRNAQLKVYGTLNIQEGVVLNFNGYSELRLEIDSYLYINPNSSVNFKDYSTYTINVNFIFEDDSPFTFEDDCNIVVNGTAELSESSTFNLINGMSCRVNGSFTLNSETTINLQDNSSLISNGKLVVNSGSTLNVNNLTKFNSNGKLILNEGVTINLQYYSPGEFELRGVIESLGSTNNSVTINCSSSSNTLKCINVDTLLMQHSIINSGRIQLVISDGIQKPRLISISNSNVNNSPDRNFFLIINTQYVDITLSDNSFSFSNQTNSGLFFSGFSNIHLIRDTIYSAVAPISMYGPGIEILNNETTVINDCNIKDFYDGIRRGYPVPEELEDVELIYSEDIRISYCTFDGGQYNTGAGILIEKVENFLVSDVEIEFNNISNFKKGILVNNSDNFSLQMNNNTIANYSLFGISLSNGNEGGIKENIITANESTTDECIGISVLKVNNPSLIGNSITAYNVSNPGSGIVSVSMSDGQIRNNTIRYHQHGIELGSSSPFTGANTITDNQYCGIYISDRSNPDLSAAFVGNELYPLSGYNTIRENGLCNQIGYSELYLVKSTINLEKGCNTVADDREEQLSCGYFYLIDGEGVEDEIQAQKNYWGAINESNPEGRFGENIVIDYEGWRLTPCTYGAGGGELILSDSRGTVYDTVYSTGIIASGLTDIESRYADANNNYFNNQFTQANQEYLGIIQDYGNIKESLQAYNRIYTIANLTNNTPGEFSQLRDFYIQKVTNQTDSVMIGTLTHLSDLCLVSAKEYITAINNFDEIAQQNPNTDVALYRQIDALTTSLLMPQDTSLNKGVLGKYSVNNLSEYSTKLSELLRTRGKSGLESGEEILPTEYTLYQNYPNPFNPATTIKYDLPNASDVSLIIYDILGRKVKELVSTKQQAGRYEILFDASSLASGVYIYQLMAEKFISSKKMILLK